MDIDQENECKPFYTVYYKCDDTFKPIPSPLALLINLIIGKLIKKKLPHMVVQNSHKPSTDVLKTMIAWVYYCFPEDLKMLYSCKASDWIDDDRILLVIESHDEKLPTKESDIFWTLIDE